MNHLLFTLFALCGLLFGEAKTDRANLPPSKPTAAELAVMHGLNLLAKEESWEKKQ